MKIDSKLAVTVASVSNGMHRGRELGEESKEIRALAIGDVSYVVPKLDSNKKGVSEVVDTMQHQFANFSVASLQRRANSLAYQAKTDVASYSLQSAFFPLNAVYTDKVALDKAIELLKAAGYVDTTDETPIRVVGVKRNEDKQPTTKVAPNGASVVA